MRRTACCTGTRRFARSIFALVTTDGYPASLLQRAIFASTVHFSLCTRAAIQQSAKGTPQSDDFTLGCAFPCFKTAELFCHTPIAAFFCFPQEGKERADSAPAILSVLRAESKGLRLFRGLCRSDRTPNSIAGKKRPCIRRGEKELFPMFSSK